MDPRASRYVRKFGPDALACLLLGATCWFIAWLQAPGYMMFGDSFTRWTFAKAIHEQGLFVDYSKQHWNNWLHTFPVVLLAWFQSIAPGLGAFAKAQAVLTGLGLYAVFRSMFRPAVALLAVLAFLAVPVNAVCTVLHMTESLLLVFVPALALTLIHRESIVGRIGSLGFAAVVAVTLLLCVWARPNFVLCAPVVGLLMVPGWRRKAVAALALSLLSVGLMRFWDKVLSVDNVDVAAVSMAAEIAGVSKYTNGRVCPTCLDEVGNTAAARANYRDEELNIMLFTPNGGLDGWAVARKDNARKIRAMWLSILVQEPRAFFEMKWRRMKPLLGLSYPFWFTMVGRSQEPERTIEACQCTLGPARAAIGKLTLRNFGGDFQGRPVVTYGVAAILMLAAWRINARASRTMLVYYSLAVAYYASYVLNMQRAEFRYFYPSWAMLMTVCAVAVLTLSREAYGRVRVHGSPPRVPARGSPRAAPDAETGS